MRKGYCVHNCIKKVTSKEVTDVYDKKRTGTFIQSKRLEARLTQEMLSERMGCSVRHIVNVERGAAGLSIELMLKLCETLRVTPNEVLFPHEQQGDAGIDWVTESLKSMSPEQRKTAVSIIGPYIESVLRQGGR